MKNVFIVLFSLLIGMLLFVAGYFDGLSQIPQQAKSFPKPISPTPILVDSQKLTILINAWRSSQSLPSYIQEDDLCTIAQDRVLNDPPLDDHQNFYKKYGDYPSSLQENLTSVTEITSGSPENTALDNWLSSPPHKATLERPYKYSCVYCKDDYCSQIFSNLENGTR